MASFRRKSLAKIISDSIRHSWLRRKKQLDMFVNFEQALEETTWFEDDSMTDVLAPEMSITQLF